MASQFGFLLVDKVKGMNSFGVVKLLRKELGLKRIGYAGTLDPLASGLMLVALGEATKLLTFLEKLDKVYFVEATLGAFSKTYDGEGPLTAVDFQGVIDVPLLQSVLLESFSGERLQKPPAYSAIKINGKRAYAMARKGQEVVLKERAVTFFDLKIDSFSWPKLLMTVHCSSGTYIRSFVHDFGQILGCSAYTENLRRLSIGSFLLDYSVPLENITAKNVVQYLLSPADIFKNWLQFELNEAQYAQLKRGGFIENVDGFKVAPILAFYQGECVGILEFVQTTFLQILK